MLGSPNCPYIITTLSTREPWESTADHARRDISVVHPCMSWDSEFRHIVEPHSEMGLHRNVKRATTTGHRIPAQSLQPAPARRGASSGGSRSCAQLATQAVVWVVRLRPPLLEHMLLDDSQAIRNRLRRRRRKAPSRVTVHPPASSSPGP